MMPIRVNLDLGKTASHGQIRFDIVTTIIALLSAVKKKNLWLDSPEAKSLNLKN